MLVISTLGGWYLTESLKDTAILFASGIVVMFLIREWQSVRFTKRMKQSGIEDIDQMTGSQFEEYIGSLLASQGYSVKYTPATGDYGADVIVIQAKKYSCREGHSGSYSFHQNVQGNSCLGDYE